MDYCDVVVVVVMQRVCASFLLLLLPPQNTTCWPADGKLDDRRELKSKSAGNSRSRASGFYQSSETEGTPVDDSQRQQGEQGSRQNFVHHGVVGNLFRADICLSKPVLCGPKLQMPHTNQLHACIVKFEIPSSRAFPLPCVSSRRKKYLSSICDHRRVRRKEWNTNHHHTPRTPCLPFHSIPKVRGIRINIFQPMKARRSLSEIFLCFWMFKCLSNMYEYMPVRVVARFVFSLVVRAKGQEVADGRKSFTGE